MTRRCCSTAPDLPRPGELTRRRFLSLGGATLLLLSARPGDAFAESSPAAVPADPRRGVLVVFFQRGAADGMHMVPAYRDPRYRSLRGSLALPEPADSARAKAGRGEERPLDLGDGFALHPSLAALHPVYAEGRLAVVHAIGSPDVTRSHFDAQDYMESGTPGNKGTRDGWLARTLAALPGSGDAAPSPFQAIAVTNTVPRSLAGARNAIALDDDDLAMLGGKRSLEERLQGMYAASDREMARTGSEAFAALELFREKDPLSIPPREGVVYPRSRAGEEFRKLGALLKGGLGIRVACLDGGGWDTHINQSSAALGRAMAELAGGAAALLRDVELPVTLLVVTEFGRTLRANGSGGTDHGHGTAMMVMGSGVAGGRVAGRWPGLADLHEGRDLPVTTDFRDLFAEVAGSALGLDAASLFPGYAPRPVGVMG